jgi:hypothetical protein
MESYQWVDLRCNDCRHEWTFGPEESTPVQEMEGAGVPMLFEVDR